MESWTNPGMLCGYAPCVVKRVQTACKVVTIMLSRSTQTPFTVMHREYMLPALLNRKSKLSIRLGFTDLARTIYCQRSQLMSCQIEQCSGGCNGADHWCKTHPFCRLKKDLSCDICAVVEGLNEVRASINEVRASLNQPKVASWRLAVGRVLRVITLAVDGH